MKAAILEKLGSPLVVRDIAEPIAGPGEAVVEVKAVRVLAYAGEVFSGVRRYLLELPIVPGAGGIGRVAALGADAAHVKIGDWVYCDPTIRARDNAAAPEIVLQGLTAGSQNALPLQRHFHDGSYAQKLRLPLENLTPLGELNPEEAGRWSTMGMMLVPYGGWLAIDLKAGETALVSGATGAFGSAAVAVALAMGARCVIAAGRNQAVLNELARRFGARVRAVRMTGTEEVDRAALLQAAPGPIDCVLDILPPAAQPAQVRAAMMAVRANGRVVLMGGLPDQPALDVPYSWLMRNSITLRGQWMYPREAAARMVGMIRAGLIDLRHYDAAAFPLERVNDAVVHAAANAGPFSMTLIEP